MSVWQYWTDYRVLSNQLQLVLLGEFAVLVQVDARSLSEVNHGRSNPGFAVNNWIRRQLRN